MRGVQALLGWRSAHPRVTDLGVAAVAGVVALWGPDTGPEQPGRLPGPGPGDVGPDTFVILWVLATVLALVWRRWFRWPVWAVALVADVVITVHLGGPSGALALPLLALYTIGTRATVSQTVVATVLTAAVLSAAGAPEGWQAQPALSMLAFCGAAAAVGVAVRGYRGSLEAAQARALQAERFRAEEATRLLTDERLRIARELHDVVAHHISVINVQAGVARHLMSTQPRVAHTALTQIRTSSRTVLAEMSTVLGLLRTGEDDRPTAPAPTLDLLPDLVDTMVNAGLRVDFRTDGDHRPWGELHELTAYRVVQESLTNALKHGAGTADLSLDHGPDHLLILVSNPVGDGPPAMGGGHGIVGMRERVASVGGRFSADRRDGRFVVRVEIPREVSA